MAFDPAHVDWASGKHHTSGDAMYGDDWGDRSPRELLRALGVARERATVDTPLMEARRAAAEAYAARLERHARKRRSAKAEREILKQRREAARARATAFGTALAEALAANLELRVAFPSTTQEGPTEALEPCSRPRCRGSLRRGLGLSQD